MRTLRSKEMRREDVDDCGEHEQEKQRNVQDVPSAEHTLIQLQRPGFLDGRQVDTDQIRNLGDATTPIPLRPPPPPPFDCNDAVHLCNYPPANDPTAPAGRWQLQDRGENTIRRCRTMTA